MRARALLLLALAAAARAARSSGAAAMAAALALAQPDCEPGPGPATENCSPFVNVTLYGEALCPYTAAFVVSTLAPLLPPGGRPYQTFWGLIDFSFVAWGNAQAKEHVPPKCQHGAAECRLNRIINCAQKLHPSQRQWLPFVVCLEARPTLIKSAGLAQPEAEVGACAREAGLDPIKLHTCASGPLGTQLEREAGAATAALRPPHTYVPWVTVNGIPIGELDSMLRTLVCLAFPGRKPAACWDPPPDRSAAAALDARGARQ